MPNQPRAGNTARAGRWAEVMASDDEPADDWQEQAAREAVDLFAPGAADWLKQRDAALVAEAKVEALRDAAAVCASSPNPDWRYAGDMLLARAKRIANEALLRDDEATP